jgi:hypothetical protein
MLFRAREAWHEECRKEGGGEDVFSWGNGREVKVD